MSFSVVDEVPVSPTARVYTEGWQSWSPTTWYETGQPLQVPDVGVDDPRSGWQHTMRFRPGVPLPEDGSLQAEGLLVVDPGDGGPSRWYGSPRADEVATLRARLHAETVSVTSSGAVDTGSAPTVESALADWAAGFATTVGVGSLRPPPRVWCSWYQYFEHLTTADLLEAVHACDEHDLPVDVVQIDDGWSRGYGEWLAASDGVPSLAAAVDRIRGSGRRAGLWLAPFLVGTQTDLARRHPDWLVGYAGHNWGQDLAGLDLTHPAVREHLATTIRDLCALGVDYLKLDFLYGGAVPGPRHEDLGPEAAYRSGLRLLRDVVGPEVYLVGCGAPILPSVGLVDAMRVSPDTFHEGGEDGSRGLRGRMSLAARAWQHGRLWTNDPDCLVARPSYRLREEWADTVRGFGGLRSVSDRIADLDDWGLETTRALLGSPAPDGPFPDDVVRAGAEVAAEVGRGART